MRHIPGAGAGAAGNCLAPGVYWPPSRNPSAVGASPYVGLAVALFNCLTVTCLGSFGVDRLCANEASCHVGLAGLSPPWALART